MTNAYYSLYIDKVIKLALTLSIKSVATAEVMNYYLNLSGYTVDEYDPSTWKYFLNLAGQYHASDTMMQVVSADTLEVIDFTTENLALHLATKRNYAYGTRYYKSLVAQYPAQEDLILRIVNPIDIDTAIAAEDGEILWYDTALVDSNETSLMPELQNWIYRVMGRWNIPSYRIIDDLYPATHLAMIAGNIPMFIINHRLEKANTIEAHDFHIRMHLASHAGLDKFLPYMTKRQSLYLYRNIRYLQRHAGKQQTYDQLVKVIMEERGFPLSNYQMFHNLEAMPDEQNPTPELWRIPSDETQTLNNRDAFSIDKVLTKQDNLARSNEIIHETANLTITHQMQNSSRDWLLTKMVETVAVDDSNSQFFSRSDSDLGHWLYMAGKGYYRAIITVKHPTTGDNINLTPADAFVLYFYAWSKANNATPLVVPMFTAIQVLRDPLPTFAELRGITDNSRVDDIYIQAALSYGHVMGPVISIEGFYNVLTTIQTARMIHRDMYAIQDDLYLRAEIKKMVGRCYQDIDVFLAPEGTLYTDWFREKGLNVDTIEFGQWEDFYKELFEEATGSNLDNSYSLAELQWAMVEIMNRLSSYNIQFLRDINTDAIVTDEWAAIRYGDYQGEGEGEVMGPDFTVDVTDFTVETSISITDKVPNLFINEQPIQYYEEMVAYPIVKQPQEIIVDFGGEVFMEVSPIYTLEIIEE